MFRALTFNQPGGHKANGGNINITSVEWTTLGSVVAPLTSFLMVVTAPLQNLIGIIEARRAQLEESGATQEGTGMANDELIASIRTHLNDRIASEKIPRTFEMADQLPRDENGKLYKRRLRDAHWQGRTSRLV